MEELNNTLWELLQTIQWSYAALWTLTPDHRMLKWQEGWYNLKAAGNCDGRESDNKNAELFYFLYHQLTFGPGVGFAGHALDKVSDSVLWLAGDEALASIPNPVENQTLLMKAAGIQTAVCIPLQDKVLELGTTNLVPENDELAHCIKKILYTLLDRFLKKAEPCHFSGTRTTFGLDVGALNPSPALTSAAAAAAIAAVGTGPSSMVPAISHDFPSLSSKPLGHSMAMVDLPTVYSEIDPHYIERAMSAPELIMPNGLAWTSEQLQPLHHLFQNDLDIWSCSTPSLGATGLQGSSSHRGGMGVSASAETSSIMVDQIDQGLAGLPFIDHHVSNLLGAANADVASAAAAASSPSPPNVPENGAPTTSLPDRSSSRSSLSSAAAAHLEDHEISSVAKVYADCQISEGKNEFMTARENEIGSWVGGPPAKSTRVRRSQSPNERSSDTLSKPKVPNQTLQLPGGLKFHPGSSLAEPGQQQRGGGRLERQQSSSSTKSALDTTPVLLQVGNVLQLGNASGEVAEALPQEHDEAAVSHMLAERRRRIKQNENFTQLKALIPTAAKLDKASVLAETIVYINNLKTRLETLEQCNESLKILVGDKAADLTVPSSANGRSLAANRAPSPPRPSPSISKEPVEVAQDGEGNLRIEIRGSSAQPESAIHVLTTLKQMQLRVLSSQMSLDDDRITATFIVKMKRKNSNVQKEVCASVASELRRCLGF